ncbi:5-dehydro-4-deoxyglucarate dehydratase [Actinoallomurus liliacearum]|uniref:Probable 5-dehydro-4-deoxyglucarate dehydratase n=1 Tax=Actinoallomurus liliacearum TaxID=1080073 RepID=A0ABP8TRN0_9ACTN
MPDLTPREVAQQLGSGLLSFPVTHLTADGVFDEPAYREHVAWLSGFPAAGLFAAGGTGEFFSLSLAEVERVVGAAVAAAPVGLPVIAPAGYGTAIAAEMARAAERAGADGVLLFPPYLTEAGQEGLRAHVRAVCRATSLGVIVYNRANARYDAETVARLAEECPNLVGYKDGVGDIEQMTRIYARLGDRLTYIGGLPTAEMFALPYLSLGLTTYSSAIFNFLPRYAAGFYEAVRHHDDAAVMAALEEFVIPYCDLRNRRPGYAVSIIKAGLKVVGRPAGPVRPPLTDLDDAELAELQVLIDKVA